MSKDYLRGQALIALQCICLIYIHRNDFYRKTKRKTETKNSLILRDSTMYDRVGDNVCVIL